ncbi:hypothetical protein Glove_478g73 [Diversispora epigaea]|uniref:Uncharacterized protein n=1 Tax=Diversispora epigaea TaxID=1348612 RepID=A0A397GP17_9GLOM|nr:hypothetical protein Glove_478g73 [Diversispora epigaea]
MIPTTLVNSDFIKSREILTVDSNYNVDINNFAENRRILDLYVKEDFIQNHHLCHTTSFYGLTKEPSNNGLDNANVMKKRNMEI